MPAQPCCATGCVVYLANFVGAVATPRWWCWSGRSTAGDGAVGARALDDRRVEVGPLPFGEALVSGILANGLVCLAVWMTLSAHTLVDKVVVIVPPIAAFVAAGYEHSIANMYFFPVAAVPRAHDRANQHVTWANFLVDNLLPVTLGNIIGGAVLGRHSSTGSSTCAVAERRSEPEPGRFTRRSHSANKVETGASYGRVHGQSRSCSDP